MTSKRYKRLLILLCIILFVFFSCQSPKQKKANSPYHHFNRSRIYYEQGRIQEAITEIKKAIKMDSKNARFHQFLGFIYFSVGDYPQAEEAYLKSLDLNSGLTEAHNHLGVLYLHTDRLDEALNEFREALKDRFYPTPEIIYFHLNELYQKRDNLEEAATQLRRALEINPKYYRAHYALGDLLTKMGDMEEAIFEYKVAETNKMYQRDPDFQFAFAMAYLKAGQNERAKRHLLKVVDLAPGTPIYIRARETLDTLD
jgi:tetratricopeptide (TPR) repeat protein